MFRKYKSNVISSIFRMDKFALYLALFIVLLNFIITTTTTSKVDNLLKSLSISLPTLVIVYSGVYSMISLSNSSIIAMNLSVDKIVFGRHFIIYNFLVGLILPIFLTVFIPFYIKLSLINILMLFVLLFTLISFYSSLFLASMSISTIFTSNSSKMGSIISQSITLIIGVLLSIGVNLVISKTNVLNNILISEYNQYFYFLLIILLTLNLIFRFIFLKNYSKRGFEMVGFEVNRL
ncbi:hypothetical protein [Oceanirhabdus sp. W0125-5]|uniref:hypothetical protein n=1 Tax=Oceanirhabdus sp. W0125-5 TaxID=2999116 RepID=UPI0022F2C3C7|nr:hypothetical protein [Oceanirhabdus sp. W0125-5]WBW99139.1 hypothetical protein OW730_10440 [Oceanirhabdus sp. W0125-5]